MPELPEVEGFRAFADRHLVGRTVVRARALDDWMLKEPTPRAFARRLSGRTFGGTARRGKVLIVFTKPHDGERDAPALALHFGMTGELVAGGGPHRWDRVVLDLDDGTTVRYRNMRRLGFVRLLARTDLSNLLWGLGPDALEAPAGWFAEVLATRRAPIKTVLLDQGFVAGVGNIYADEALHAAGIRPERRKLNADESKRLHTAMRRVLRRGTMRVPRSRDEPCPRCGAPIRSKMIGGRTAYFCTRCQR